MAEMKLDLLPEECIAYVLSFASTRDACHMCLVSSAVQAAAESDGLWEEFLPSDYQEILSRLVSPPMFKSKKELFLRLCSPILLDEGNKVLWKIKSLGEMPKGYYFHDSISSSWFLDLFLMFWLDKSTSKKCYMLSVRELSITWANDPLYWSWKPLPLQSRFAEVAELITTWWLEISGRIQARTLSPNTTYGAYLIVKFADRAYGLDSLPSEVSVEIGNHQLKGTIHLRRPEDRKQWSEEERHCKKTEAALRSRVFAGEQRVACEREDGWLEIELGYFYNDGSDEEVKMSLKEVKGPHLKGGLLVEGIELRPNEWCYIAG